MDIINDKPFAKKQKIRIKTRSSIGINKIEKTFCHQQTIDNARSKKINGTVNGCFRQNDKSNGFPTRKILDYYSKKLIPIETNYTIGDKKMFAVVVTLKH